MSRYRYKKQRSSKKGDNPHFLREKELNRKLNHFCKLYKECDLQNIDIYSKMNLIRLEIKALFYKQEYDLFHQSANRRRIYFEQLARFKGIYSSWKKRTYGIFLYVTNKIPKHLIYSIQTLKRNKLISSYLI